MRWQAITVPIAPMDLGRCGKDQIWLFINKDVLQALAVGVGFERMSSIKTHPAMLEHCTVGSGWHRSCE